MGGASIVMWWFLVGLNLTVKRIGYAVLLLSFRDASPGERSERGGAFFCVLFCSGTNECNAPGC